MVIKRQTVAVTGCVASVAIGAVLLALNLGSMKWICFGAMVAWGAMAWVVDGMPHSRQTLRGIYGQARAGSLPKRDPISSVITVGLVALTITFLVLQFRM